MVLRLLMKHLTLIVPRFLYVPKKSWSEEGEVDPEIADRMDLLLRDLQDVEVRNSEPLLVNPAPISSSLSVMI